MTLYFSRRCSWFTLEWDLWAAGISHCCLKTPSEQHLPKNWNVLGKQTGLLQLKPSLFFSYLFFLSDGYNTNGPHFSFSLALLTRNRDIGISLNSLHVCAQCQSKHPAKFQEGAWRQL